MTSLQRRNLQLYLRFRGQRMSIARLLWANRFIYTLLVFVFGAFAAFLYFAIGPFAAGYVGVAFAVLILVLFRQPLSLSLRSLGPGSVPRVSEGTSVPVRSRSSRSPFFRRRVRASGQSPASFLLFGRQGPSFPRPSRRRQFGPSAL